MEIKNTLTVSRGEVGGIVGGEGGRVFRNVYKGHMGKTKGGWEVGMAGMGGSGEGKMETTVLEQQ